MPIALAPASERTNGSMKLRPHALRAMRAIEQGPDERVCSFVRRDPAPTNKPNPKTLSTPAARLNHHLTPHADGHAIRERLRQDFTQRCLEAGRAILVAETIDFGSA
jgi:hypothetical protein